MDKEVNARLEKAQAEFIDRLGQIRDDDGYAYQDSPEFSKIAEKWDVVNGSIEELETTIKKILSKQYEEYVTAFKNFMDKNRKDMCRQVDMLQNKVVELKKKYDESKIKQERDFFRTEAVRLNGLCKQMSSKIEEMTFRIKQNSDDITQLNNKLKASENVNKQLLVELESNIQEKGDLEKEYGNLKERIEKYGEEEGKGSSYSLIEKSQNENSSGIEEKQEKLSEEKVQSDKLQEEILRLQNELKKEKTLYRKNIKELNKMSLEKNQLENIFADCLEQAQRDILNRKLRETMQEGFMAPKRRMAETEKDIQNSAKYENFLPSDKRRLIEEFFSKEESIQILKEIVFHKPKNEVDKTLYQGLNILNEHRINPVAPNKPGEFAKSIESFDMFMKRKGNSMGFKFNLSNGFGKKTHLNFGFSGKLNKMK